MKIVDPSAGTEKVGFQLYISNVPTVLSVSDFLQKPTFCRAA